MDQSAQIPASIPEVLPVLSSEEMILLPGAIVGLQLEGASASAQSEIEKTTGLFVVARPEGEGLHPIGILARVVEVGQSGKGKALLIRALARVRILEMVSRQPIITARVEKLLLPDVSMTPSVHALMLEAKRLSREILALLPGVSPALGAEIEALKDPNALADLLAFRVPSPPAEKERLLLELDVEKRLEAVVELLGKRREVIQVSTDIDSSVRKQVSKAEREHLLRQRRKAIERELAALDGSSEENEDGTDKLSEALAKAALPAEVRTQVDRELKRLGAIGEASPERNVARSWLQWIADMPWGVTTKDSLDVIAARRVLDADHQGLDRVKSRISQYLAVRSLKGDMKGPILCFVGPPGVGKTSLGQSIAKAMGRKFVRVSLGGVRDEAEIRGHRRTYVGALPGRIVQAMKRAGSANPVVLLDEIDKLGQSSMGDPSAALLEVLDPEQNNSFADHYLEVPFDLSGVLFIATANMLDTIPAPLRDRMEIIELPGYALDEKVSIARAHLWPKQVAANGLSGEIAIGDAALKRIVANYTREAGVRSLERKLAEICRQIAVEQVEGKLGLGASVNGSSKTARFVSEHEIEALLGPDLFEPQAPLRAELPGVAAGLAWTPVGGELLFIEATEMPGNGKLIITGQLGEVMRESAQAAFSYLRSRALDYGLPADPLAGRDIHLHVPDGGTKKDGPSAGVTIFTALLSLLTGIRVRGDVAMTGETTLRGRVLPVGGIKEKVLAAHRAGIKRIILPERCERDLRDVPESAKQELEFVFVSRLDQVIEAALERIPQPASIAPLAPRSQPAPVGPTLRAA